MADEENREPEEIRDGTSEQENAFDNDAEPPARGWLSRRNLFILALIPLVLIAAALIAGFLAVRTGYVARYIERNFVEQLDKMGLRTEVRQFEQTFAPLGVAMHDVNLYDKVTGEKLAYIKYLKLDATVTDLYALNLNRTVRLDATEVDGLEAWVRFDEEGRSNLSRLEIPEQEESNLRFNFNTMKFSIKNSIVHYGDRRLDLTGDARNVALFIEPDKGVSDDEREVENRRFKFDLSASGSTVTYQSGKPVEPIDVRVRGVATETYADIAELNLKSPAANTILTGRLEDWENLRFRLNVEQAAIDLQQTGEILQSETALRGIGNFVGTIEGAGEKYQINGEVFSDALAADNVRLRGLRANASIVGENETYEANGKAVAELLTFGDFQLNLMQIAGKVMGTGTDFRWLGELQAASARFPDGNVAKLILNDAAAEYSDGRLDATIGSASAGALEAFDARVRGGRASNVRIKNTNAGTDATIGAVRADSVVRDDLNLRGVRAANVRVRSRESTNVEIGSLQANNLQTETANIQNLNAGGVTINSRGDAVTANLDTVAASNLTAEGANIRDLRGRNVRVENIGNATNVIAANLQIGGLKTAQASLGSLNIAGVRLRVVGDRIEGSSGDVNAGNVTLARSASLPEGGVLRDVRISRPVFVVEPSGRYRASLDLSLGGGAVGSLNVGAARATVVASSSDVQLSNLNAQVIGGALRGDVNLALGNRANSRINATFENLDVSKILTLAGGQVVPVAGTVTGTADLTFPGTNFRRASGTLNADIAAEAGRDAANRVPLTGTLAVRATSGLFDIETARINTQNTEVTASGRFDLEGANSNLQVALNSSDAKELQRLIAALDVAPALDKQLADNRIELAGNVSFNGTITGNLTDPTVNGRAALENLIANNRSLGALSTDVSISPAAAELRNGQLAQADGGRVNFDIAAPRVGQNNISINANLERVNLGNILAAVPAESLPAFLQRVEAETTGKVELEGLPGAIRGRAEIAARNGTIAGESFQNLEANVQFDGAVARIERFNANFDQGTLTAAGTYNQETELFDLTATAQNIPVSKIRAFLGESAADAPNITGTLNLTASGTGRLSDFSTFNVNFEGAGRDIIIAERALGNVTFVGRTQNQQLTANLTADIAGQQQTANATVNFADPNLPFRAETAFNNTDLAPLAALAQPAGTMTLGGRATGTAVFAGNLRSRDAAGNLIFSTDSLRGTAKFSQLTLQVESVVLTAADPLLVSFTTSQVTFDNTRFTGSGSDLTISGTAFFAGAGASNLAVNGRINLGILNSISPNQFFAGFANIAASVSGTTSDPRFAGSATLDNAAFAAIVGDSRLSLSNLTGRILFNSNQVQIPQIEGRLGGGRVVASGGAVLKGLTTVDSFSLGVRGDDVSVPLPPDFRTTGDVDLQIAGRTESGVLNTTITGDIFADRISYTKDINLSDFLSRRQAASITEGGGTVTAPGTTRVNIRVEGRDALVVRNNIADITGSLSLRVTGDASEPVIAGRITVTQGNVVLLNDQRYDITRAIVDLPAELGASPIINVQAESDIGGYQVFLAASGPIAEPESLNVSLRSNPGLPQADVVSLVTTGNLSNTDSGIPTLAQTGINTAAGVLTENIINAPIRRATDRLFGLNRFDIDPVLAGQRGINPGARLTVGRQINRNLLVTYSTNLSNDQNQILALEYRVSNRVSFIAQYEQAALTNVTRRRDNFSFEVRFRRRF